MHVTVITPPAAIVTVAEAKAHLRVDHADDDTIIAGFVAAAQGTIDGPAGYLGRSIGSQTLEARTDRFCTGPIELPYGPVISITSIKYLDEDAVEQTVASSGVYEMLTDGRIALVTDAEWPDIDTDNLEAVRYRYVAGYAAVPAPIKAAVLLMTAFLYDNREASGDDALTTGAVKAMLSAYRVWSV